MSVQDSFIFFVGAVITLVCFCVFFRKELLTQTSSTTGSANTLV